MVIRIKLQGFGLESRVINPYMSLNVSADHRRITSILGLFKMTTDLIERLKAIDKLCRIIQRLIKGIGDSQLSPA